MEDKWRIPLYRSTPLALITGRFVRGMTRENVSAEDEEAIEYIKANTIRSCTRAG